jgi:hypothetical protein
MNIRLRKAMILWLADSGAEGHLLVSIGTLRLAAPKLWNSTPKVVVDCGLSTEARSFLERREAEDLHVIPVAATGTTTQGQDAPGIMAMRTRIETSRFVTEWRARSLVPSSDTCLVCDSDTVFMRDFECPQPDIGAHLMIMREWDNRTGVDEPMRLMRRSTFAVPLEHVDAGAVSRSLELPASTLATMPTYNTGVFVFRIGVQFSAHWRAEYERVIAQRDERARPVFSLYAAEQNALAIAIERGTLIAGALPREFNQFPPRPPGTWPDETAIGHFISFGKSHGEERYSRWFSARDAVRAAGWVPPALLSRLTRQVD